MFDASPVSSIEATHPVTCPSCHTARVLATDEIPDASAHWRCPRCGEHWTASRLATVSDYEAWDRERSGRRASTSKMIV
jgi:predicted Zn finger-like uncharacterized protein